MGINFKTNFKAKCKFSSKPSLVRPSPLMSNQQTPSKTSRLRSKTRKVSHQINKDSSLLVSNSRMVELSVTTTSKRNPPSISSSDLEVVCKSLLKPSLVRPSPLMSNQQTQSKTSRPRSKTRKVSHQINKDSSSLVSNLKMAEPFQITTFKRNLPFIWFSDLEVANETLIKLI